MRKSKLYILSASLCFGVLITSCVKEINYGVDPYGESANILDVKFLDVLPSPSQARPGEEVTYMMDGLSSINVNDMLFYVNNNPAEITAYTDSTLTVLLPKTVSTGSARLVVNGQTFAGPLTPILGKLAIDPIFNPGTGSNGFINTIKRLSNGQFFLGGYFTDYNGSSSLADVNGLARITATGEYVTGMSFGEGVKNGSVTNILELPAGQIFIGGNFNTYDKDETVRGMTLLNVSGSLNLETVDVLNLTDDPEKNTLEVPVFNGGVMDGGVVKAFYRDNKITLVGGFKRYTSNYYERSTYNQLLRDYFSSENILRVNLNGSLDSTFLVNHNVLPKRGSYGVNGSVQDAVMDTDGRIIMVGGFTRYNNAVASNRILRLSASGAVDQSFKPGTGADNTIFKIVEAADSKYYLLGSFLNYNGQSANNIALINADGSVNTSFKAKSFSGGIPTYMAVLDNGLLLVTGSFNRYDGVIREGLLVLNPDGTLAEGYNNTGKLVGGVTDSYVGTNSIGQRTITLVGLISSFNGKSELGNIVRLTIQD